MGGLVNGRGNFSSPTRDEHDYYATHPSAVYPLFAVEDFGCEILEPACGEGHMAKAIEECGHSVTAFDLVDRGYGGVFDFLDLGACDCDIVTNPPYKLQSEFVEHGMSLLRDGRKMALFLKIQFLESAKRKALFSKHPPARIHVFSKRARTAKNGDFENIGSALTCYAWFVWEHGFSGKPTVDWIEPMAGAPGSCAGKCHEGGPIG